MPTGLVDYLGRPIQRRALTAEVAAPTLTGVRSVLTGHPAAGLTPQRLAAILREAEGGDAVRYLELAEDIEERDWHYPGVLGTRKRAVAQLDITVEAAADDAASVRHADLVRDWLGRDELADELFDLMDALGKGYGVAEIVWDTSEGQWLPARLEWRDPRWFDVDPADGRALRLRTDTGPVPLTPFKFVVHTPKIKSGLPIRGGLTRPAAWAWLFKSFSLKDWVIFAEVYGQPLRLGKYGVGATAQDKDTLMRAVAGIGSDCAAIVPESMAIEFIQAQLSGSHDLFERLCDWLDRQVSKLVLGQTLTTEVSGGSLAAARVHDEVRGDIRQADGRQLAATLNRDLVRPFIDLNFGRPPAYPRLRLGLPDDLSTTERLGLVKDLVPIGLKVQMSEVRDLLGFGDPDDGAELLMPPAPPPAPAAPPPAAPPPADTPPDATAAQAASPADQDLIDAAVETLLGDWEPMVRPAVEQILQAAREAADIEDFRRRLAALAGHLDLTGLTGALDRGGFAAGLAGRLGESLS